jgi:hypothetical protein
MERAHAGISADFGERIALLYFDLVTVGRRVHRVELVLDSIKRQEQRLAGAKQLVDVRLIAHGIIFGALNVNAFNERIFILAHGFEVCDFHLFVDEEPHLADGGHAQQNTGVVDQVLSLNVAFLSLVNTGRCGEAAHVDLSLLATQGRN